MAFRAVWPQVEIMVLKSEGFPSLNNAGDLVLLRDDRDRCMDSIWYQQSWGRGPGVSIERVDPLSASHDARAWGSCRDSAGATPGRINSIVIQEHDLLAGTLSLISDNFPESIRLRAVIHNAGRQASGLYSVRLLDDVDRDSVGTDAEVVTSLSVAPPIPSKDSLSVELLWGKPSPGNHQVLAEIVWTEDQRPENNTSVAIIQVTIPRGTLCINEIHASPIGGTNMSRSGTRRISYRSHGVLDHRQTSPLRKRQSLDCVDSNASASPGGTPCRRRGLCCALLDWQQLWFMFRCEHHRTWAQ
jgi:hypothetical protein